MFAIGQSRHPDKMRHASELFKIKNIYTQQSKTMNACLVIINIKSSRCQLRSFWTFSTSSPAFNSINLEILPAVS